MVINGLAGISWFKPAHKGHDCSGYGVSIGLRFGVCLCDNDLASVAFATEVAARPGYCGTVARSFKSSTSR
jgi:hypothetical protein